MGFHTRRQQVKYTLLLPHPFLPSSSLYPMVTGLLSGQDGVDVSPAALSQLPITYFSISLLILLFFTALLSPLQSLCLCCCCCVMIPSICLLCVCTNLKLVLLSHMQLFSRRRGLPISQVCFSSFWGLSLVVLPFVSSSKWVYLQQRHRNQKATTATCNQLQWLPPSFPASRGRYQAEREEDPHYVMLLSWIFQIATQNRSLLSKCPRRGGESQALRSVTIGWTIGEMWCWDGVCLKMHAYTERHRHTDSRACRVCGTLMEQSKRWTE